MFCLTRFDQGRIYVPALIKERDRNKPITTVSPLLITRLLVDCVKNEDILACPLILLHIIASLKLNIKFFAHMFFSRVICELGQLSYIGLM